MPTRRLAYLLLASALVAALTGPLPGLGLALILLLLAMLDLIWARHVPDIARSAPALLSRGVGAPFTMHVTGTGGGPAKIRQPVAADISLDQQEGRREVQGTLVASRRGRHVLPPVAARVVGPMGLAARHHNVGGVHELSVYPDLPTARVLARAVRRSHLNPSGERTRGPLGLGTEFDRIRDYRAEDDLRQINWRATARVGRPMSNQHRLEIEQDLQLLLDTGRLSAAAIGQMTVLDACLDAATALAMVADTMGDRCGAVTFDERIGHRLEPARGAGRRVIRDLHAIEPRLVSTDYEQAFRQVAPKRRSFAAVFCDLFDEHAATDLVRALPVLTRRHTVVVVTPRDHAVADRLRLEPGTGAEALEMLSLIDLLHARDRAVQLVRATGAQVVEAPPRLLARAAVQAYLGARLASASGARPALATSVQ